MRSVSVIDSCRDTADGADHANKAGDLKNNQRRRGLASRTMRCLVCGFFLCERAITKADEAYLKCVLMCAEKTYFSKRLQSCRHRTLRSDSLRVRSAPGRSQSGDDAS